MIKKGLFSILFLATFSATFSQEAYYSNVDLTLSGTALKDALAAKIIATHTNPLNYTPGVWEASKITDANVSNTSEVVLIYGWENASDQDASNDRTRSNTLQDTGSGASFRWNREHVYSKSLGVPTLVTNNPGAGTDAHNLRPADRTRNSTRNNFKFGDGSGNSGFSAVTYIGPSGPNTAAWYPGDEWKGDVARMMMYMYLRYGSQCLPTGVGVGDTQFTPDDMIDLFLKWNVEDPVSDFEKGRNTYHEDTNNTYAQGNRNPFIDNPYLATRIWGGDSAEDVWNLYTNTDTVAPSVPSGVNVSNIGISSIDVSWTASTDNIGVTGYDIFVNGTLTAQTTAATTVTISNLAANTSYNFTVLAKDLINNKSAQSTVVNGTTLQDSEAPTVPTNVTVSNETDTSFKISWDASTDNTAVTGYDVYLDGVFKATTTDLNYTFVGLTSSTTYGATVLAKDAVDNKSAQSAAVNGTTTSGASNGSTELFFSEYAEPAGGNNKALEIYNATSSTISLAGYTIKKQRNGADGWVDSFDLAGGSVTSIVPGDVFVVINGDSSDATLIAEADIVQPNTNATNNGSPLNFNGNDPIGLFKNGILIDIIGVFNAGSGNFAKDKTLRRKSAITSPNTTYDTNEWDSFAANTFSGIGSHSVTASIDANQINGFNVYPNPFNDTFTITSINNQRIKTITIYSVLGKKITTINNPSSSINMKHLPNGIYLLKVIIGNKGMVKKLVKM